MREFYMRHDQADELHYKYQMRHRWKWPTKVYPHLHFRPMSNGTGTFAIAGQYAWTDNDVALPANAGWTTFTATANIGVVYSDVHFQAGKLGTEVAYPA